MPLREHWMSRQSEISSLGRLINIAAIVTFIAWAYWQHNDPDAILWTVLYLLAAVSCALFLAGRLPVWAVTVLGSCALLLGLVRAYAVIAEQQYFFDEEGREMMGSLLVALYMGVLACQLRCRCCKREKRTSPPTMV